MDNPDGAAPRKPPLGKIHIYEMGAPQLAYIKDVYYGLIDYPDKPQLRFETMITEACGAGQFFDQEKAEQIMADAGVSRAEDLEGRVCVVRMQGAYIQYSHIAKF
jgi:hypothetical protein